MTSVMQVAALILTSGVVLTLTSEGFALAVSRVMEAAFDRAEFALALRARNRRYKVPTGGAYRWISCPNYFGEIVQWCGWALATWSLGGLAFAVYTTANLAPRALDHHRWYRDNFPDYPPGRRALVPFVV